MTPQFAPSFQIQNLLICYWTTGLFPQDEGSLFRFQDTNQAHGNLNSLVEGEEMEEEARVYDADLAFELVQGWIRIEGVGSEEMGFESIFVEEELVAEIDESGFEIAAP